MWPLSGFNRKKEDLIQKSHETPPGENAISICPTRTATSCRLLVLYTDLENIAFADEGRMPVSVGVQHTGDSGLPAEVRAIIEHVLADRPGDWRVSIIGSQANDRWEMKIVGPNAFERSYTLEGSSGEHRPEMIRVLLGKLVPR